MALTKKQLAELESIIGKVFKISTGISPELYVVLNKINPAIKSGTWSYGETVSLLFCEKDGTRIGTGSTSMTATKFYKKYLNQEVEKV
jgi:hypothetical protein